MQCPICDYPKLSDELRCPNCQSALTVWRNLDDYGRQAYQAGLDALTQSSAAAAELLMRALVFAPDEPTYMDAYGRVLGQLRRYGEAAAVLSRAYQLAPSEERRAAYECANSLARFSDADGPEESDASPA